MVTKNTTIIDKLLEKQHPKELIEAIINDKNTFDGNRQQFTDEYGVDYNAFSRSLSIMDKIFEKLGLYVFTGDQVKKIKRYVETLEDLIE